MRPVLALFLALAAFVAVLSAQRDQGIVRDEVVYMTYGSKYAQWWSDFATGKDAMLTETAITGHFGGPGATDNNREHPPLMKTLFGFSETLFHRQLGWASSVTAYRIPSAFMNAILIALVFLFSSAIWGRGVGALAAIFTLFLPRAFFHAGLACFDAAVVTTWFATVYAYYRALGSRRWCVVLTVVFGLALATKHNALMLPGVLGAHYLWLAARARPRPSSSVRSWARIPAELAALARGLARVRPAIILALCLGPLLAIALWPWLWFDTATHILEWVRFHLRHVHYNYEYLGQNWNTSPYPWHVPLVTTLFTVPVATLLAAAIGAAYLVRQWRRGESPALSPAATSQADHAQSRAPALLLVLSAVVAMGPFLLGSAPIFGAEKHWAPAIPTLCILAGIGVVAAAALAGRSLAAMVGQRVSVSALRRGAAIALGLAVTAAAAAETYSAQPFALSHYNALAGGAPGGADLGMNRQFWGYAARGVLPFLSQNQPTQGNAPVYSHDASPAWGIYRREGLLSGKLPDAGREGAGVRRSKLALVVHELHFNRHDYMIWAAYGTVQPAFVLTFQGVPIVSVYRRPEPESAPP